MLVIGRAINDIFKAGKSELWTRSRDKKFHLADADFDHSNSLLRLLVYINDANGASASFGDLATNKHRTEPKQAGEGRPESCHIICSIQENNTNNNTYVALVEDSALFRSYYIQMYLNSLLRKFARSDKEKFMYPDPSGAMESGKPKMARFQSRFNVIGHISPILKEAVEQGQLLQLELVTENKKQIGLGELPQLNAIRKTVTLKAFDSSESAASQYIKSALRIGKQASYEQLRIRFKDDRGKGHTADFDTETGALLTEGFVKSETLHAKEIALEAQSSPHFSPWMCPPRDCAL